MWAKTQRWLHAAGEWAVLLPVWRRFTSARNKRGAAAIATAGAWLVAILIVAAIASGGKDDEPAPSEPVAEMWASATPTRTARAAGTGTPSPAPEQPPAATAPPAVSADGAAPPAPAQVLTIVSSTTYTDDLGSLHVAGEVRNNGAEYMEFVEVTGTFFDEAGQTLASEFTFTHADIIAPGEVAGFDLTVRGGASLGVNRYELAFQGEVTAERPVSGLVIQEGSTSIDEIGDLHVVGRVLNQSAGPAEFVKVIGTFYGSDGKVMRSASVYTELDEVPSGGSDSFDLIIPDGGSLGFARYELEVEGFPI